MLSVALEDPICIYMYVRLYNERHTWFQSITLLSKIKKIVKELVMISSLLKPTAERPRLVEQRPSLS